jgi:hypothetical protein
VLVDGEDRGGAVTVTVAVGVPDEAEEPPSVQLLRAPAVTRPRTAHATRRVGRCAVRGRGLTFELLPDS